MPRSIPRTTPSVILVLALAMTLVQGLHAQTFTVIHSFTGGTDGGQPRTGVTLDRAGNIYGTTPIGGKGYGGIYKLTNRNNVWVENPFYECTGGHDGAVPTARVIFGPDGSLYGTTAVGGTTGSGVLFKLNPYPTLCKTALCPRDRTLFLPGRQ